MGDMNLSVIQNLVGGAVQTTFGQLGIPFIAILFFIITLNRLGASAETIGVLLVIVLLIMTIGNLLSNVYLLAIVIIVSIIVYLFFSKLWGLR